MLPELLALVLLSLIALVISVIAKVITDKTPRAEDTAPNCAESLMTKRANLLAGCTKKDVIMEAKDAECALWEEMKLAAKDAGSTKWGEMKRVIKEAESTKWEEMFRAVEKAKRANSRSTGFGGSVQAPLKSPNSDRNRGRNSKALAKETATAKKDAAPAEAAPTKAAPTKAAPAEAAPTEAQRVTASEDALHENGEEVPKSGFKHFYERGGVKDIVEWGLEN